MLVDWDYAAPQWPNAREPETLGCHTNTSTFEYWMPLWGTLQKWVNLVNKIFLALMYIQLQMQNQILLSLILPKCNSIDFTEVRRESTYRLFSIAWYVTFTIHCSLTMFLYLSPSCPTFWLLGRQWCSCWSKPISPLTVFLPWCFWPLQTRFWPHTGLPSS